jgi:hypothetical protein
VRDPAIVGLAICVAVGLVILFRWIFPPDRTAPARPKINVLEMQAFNPGNFDDQPSDTALLLWRLYPDQWRNNRGTIHPGFIHATRTSNTIHVFMTLGDKAHVLEDDPALFPSDTLVTKIRLLK